MQVDPHVCTSIYAEQGLSDSMKRASEVAVCLGASSASERGMPEGILQSQCASPKPPGVCHEETHL